MNWDSELYDNKHHFVAEYGKGLLEFVPADKTQKILDLGCGTGTLTAELATRGGYVLGVDGSPKMIEKAKEQYPSLAFQVMDALELPYEHEWDVVFSNAVFHWISDHDVLLKKIRQSLSPSGKLICEFGAHGNIEAIEQSFRVTLQELGHVYQSKFNFPTADAFSFLLTKNGFSIDKIYDFDRPTPLNDGERGLYNWVRQFFEAELAAFTNVEQDKILKSMQERLKAQLWGGTCWVADYRRLRVLARAE